MTDLIWLNTQKENSGGNSVGLFNHNTREELQALADSDEQTKWEKGFFRGDIDPDGGDMAELTNLSFFMPIKSYTDNEGKVRYNVTGKTILIPAGRTKPVRIKGGGEDVAELPHNMSGTVNVRTIGKVLELEAQATKGSKKTKENPNGDISNLTASSLRYAELRFTPSEDGQHQVLYVHRLGAEPTAKPKRKAKATKKS